MTVEGNLRIIRSTFAAADIGRLIQENYRDLPSDATCLFEYRGVNDIYRYTNGRRSYFLKIYARVELDKAAIEGEVEIVNHLARSGFSVADAVPRSNSEYLLSLQTPEGIRYGVLFAEAIGSPCNEVNDEDQTVAIANLFSNLHSTLDAMSTAPSRWNLDERTFLDRSLEILGYHSQFNPQIDMRFLNEVVTELKAQIFTQGSRWNWGLCHGDAWGGNIHRNDRGVLTIYDFDFCGFSWRAYDLSIFLGLFSQGFRSDVVDLRKRRLEFFLRGYDHAGGLSDSEVEAVYKVFVPFRRIFNLGYLYDVLAYVWGNRLRDEQINQDLRRLRTWMDHYG